MQKNLLSFINIFIITGLYAQRGRIGDYASEPIESVTWSEVWQPFGFGAIIFILGLVILNVFKNSDKGKGIGGCIMVLGAFIGLSGLLAYTLYGFSIIVSAIIAIGFIIYLAKEVLPNFLPKDNEKKIGE